MTILKDTIEYKVDTEAQAIALIDQARTQAAAEGQTIAKANYTYKAKKAKGEIIAEAWVVTITRVHATIWEDLEG